MIIFKVKKKVENMIYFNIRVKLGKITHSEYLV